MESAQPTLKGLLFDLDGVLYVDSSMIEGAAEALETIQRAAIRRCFITNTSTLSRDSLHQKLVAMGFDIEAKEIISAPEAARLYLKQRGATACRLLLSDDVKRDFTDLERGDDDAQYIVLGDIGDAWSYKLLNDVFNQMVRGATLIAIHKNRFWQTDAGLKMDIGGFVAALEYASGKPAMIIGKPSPDFFKVALNSMGLSASEVALIGDDVDSDVGGAQAVGMKGILVRTGKYREDYVARSQVRPDWVIDSIRDLPALLGL